MPFEEIAKEGKMEDRRMFARIDIRVPLRFLEPSSGKEGKAETVNISANGVGFIIREGLSANAPLEMWLDVPDKHEPLHLEGKVVWSKGVNDNNQTHVGVSLEKQEFISLARVLKCKSDI